MRSEVVKVRRSGRGTITGGTPNRFARDSLSDVVGDLVKVNETRDVRISVEIAEEMEEEKVGSKAFLEKHCTGDAVLLSEWVKYLNHIVKDWKPGESRKVKSILFDTPDGVPVVEFIETPRERLKRAVDTSFRGPEDIAIIDLRAAVLTYLDAATEEAEKKGGG